MIQCIICPVPVILSNKGSGDDPPNTERDNLISRAIKVVPRFGIALLAGELIALIIGTTISMLAGEEFAIWCIVDVLHGISMDICYPTGRTEMVTMRKSIVRLSLCGESEQAEERQYDVAGTKHGMLSVFKVKKPYTLANT